MKTHNMKKKVFFLSILIIGWTSILLTNPVGSGHNCIETSKFDRPNTELTDISYYSPLTSDSSGDNIIFQQLPNSDLLDNSEIINNFYNYLEDDTIIYDRPPSIISTYFIVSILDSIDNGLLLTHADKITEYLIEQYNPETKMFEDNINYTYYHERFGNGKKLLLAPYSPEITHEMALVIFKKCDKLSVFPTAQITNWISNIWNKRNVDGGFGTLFAPNSTLLETYYSIESLLALNDYDTEIFSFIQPEIMEFIESRQRTSDWTPFGIGAFGEYSEDIFVGWEFFYASWLALNSIDMIGGDFSNVKDDFINFILDNDLNNPDTHCFYGQWNDWTTPDIITYYGTAILGDCIRILDAQAQFPDLSDSQATLISANIIDDTGLDLDYNYFYWASNIPGDDLFSQYLIVNYLSKVGLWNLVDEDEFISHYLTFLTENGGATYISNIWDSAKGDYLKFNSLKYSGISDDEVYALIMSRRFATYFGDLRNISTSPQDQIYKILQHWNEWVYYPIATNYFSIKLLNEYDLIGTFYNEVGTEYEDFINWIYSKLTPEGYFCNSAEFMVSGNLESTYYALESQKILLDYDQLHDINDYYTPQELSSIISYYAQFVIEDDNYWYVNVSESPENKIFNRFESLKYVISIENILDGYEIDYEKLGNYLVYTYENEWNLLTIQEKTNLMGLLKEFGFSISDLNLEISQAQIHDRIQYIISQDHYPEDEVNFISQLLKDSEITVYMDIPSNQILGESYTYLAQFSSIASLISVENLSIKGYNLDFNNWYSLGSMFACEVVPQFDEFTPYSWDISLEFNYRDQEYSYPISFNISIPFLSTVDVNSNGDSVISVLSVECPDSLAIELEPELSVYNFSGDLVGYYQMVDISTNQGQDTIDFECNIFGGLQNNHSYSLTWNFNFDFLDNISVDFEFIGLEEPPINNPPDLSNEKINRTGKNISNSYQYEFSITYSDTDSDSPEYVKLFINETPYPMNFKYGDYQTGAVFTCNIYLEAGNYTYYFIANNGKNSTEYPQNDFFYLNVIDLSKTMPKIRSTKIGNYIIEFIISLGSVGTGISGFIFRHKQKFYKGILAKTASNVS